MEVITILKAIGIDLARVMEALLTIFIVLTVFGWKAWPRIRKFFDDISSMRSSVAEATIEAKQSKEAIVEMQKSLDVFSNTLKEHMVQTDLRMQEGDERFSELSTRLLKVENFLKIS